MALDQYGRVIPDAPDIKLTNVGQQERTELDASGTAVRGYRVSFTTESGVSGSVFVPASRYTVANVKAEVMAAAHQLEQVAKLAG